MGAEYIHSLENLRDAIEPLRQQFPELDISFDWTEATEPIAGLGDVPTARYHVSRGEQLIASGTFPAPILAQNVAEALRTALGHPQDAETQALIQAVENCPMK